MLVIWRDDPGTTAGLVIREREMWKIVVNRCRIDGDIVASGMNSLAFQLTCLARWLPLSKTALTREGYVAWL